MILLKRTGTPTVFTSATKQFNVYGRSFFNIEAVYLSGVPFPNQTFFSPFSGSSKLSATYPGFSGIRLSSSQYTTNNDNTVTFTLPSATFPGFVDIIVQNEAGYGTLTQYVIKDLYLTSQTLEQLRPWSSGIRVLSGVTV